MQQELVSPAYGDLHSSAISSVPFTSADQRLSTSPYLTNGDNFFGLYPSIFSPIEASLGQAAPFPGSVSVSLTPSSVSFDEEEGPSATENRLYLARLTLKYQEIAERYDLCLSHLHDAAQEAEALRQENAQLRIVNGELTKCLNLNQKGRIVPPSLSIVDEFRRLRFSDTPAQTSPTSVLGLRENQFPSRGTEERIPLPKSISVRSSGYLKMNPTGGAGTGSLSNRDARHRVSSPVMVGSQRVYVGSNNKEAGEGVGAESEAALEFDVYNQGMFKTELCNKWEETGECPYGDQCQFAHGIGELRPVIRHPRYKTEVCRMVLAGDPCPYGHRCHFRHTLTPDDGYSSAAPLRK